jgi:hypothetical protein
MISRTHKVITYALFDYGVMNDQRDASSLKMIA